MFRARYYFIVFGALKTELLHTNEYI